MRRARSAGTAQARWRGPVSSRTTTSSWQVELQPAEARQLVPERREDSGVTVEVRPSHGGPAMGVGPPPGGRRQQFVLVADSNHVDSIARMGRKVFVVGVGMTKFEKPGGQGLGLPRHGAGVRAPRP